MTKIHDSAYQEEPLFIRALQGHSGNNQENRRFFFKKIEKSYVPFLYHIGFSRNEDSIRSGGLVPGGPGKQRQESSVLRPEAQAVPPLEESS